MPVSGSWLFFLSLFLQRVFNLIHTDLKDVHGHAILDFFVGNPKGPLIIHNNYDVAEEMPVEVFFRNEEDFTSLEHIALQHCHGSIMDLGAGAGAHSLVLQEMGKEVYAIENSPGCVEVMQRAGISNVLFTDYRKHNRKYDTILVMMNGLGLAGTLQHVNTFISSLLKMLHPGGQLLMDSSDIAYLYQEKIQPPIGYYGEVRYQYEYDGVKGEWFDWVYVDPATLGSILKKMKLNFEILATDPNDQFLFRIQP